MGDFEQIYTEIAESDGRRCATLWYWRQVARSIPFFVSDTILWTFIMLKNYFLVARRNLYKNKASSFVNIVGLSVAVAIAVTVFLFIERQFTMDGYHENADNIFLVENQIARGKDVQLRGDTPVPLGPAMQARIPQVKRAIRVGGLSSTFKVGDNTFREYVRLVDPEFLDMFSFELRLGDKAAPIGHDDIVLSDEMAKKYFGEENPMGQDLTVIFNDQETRVFTVRGVARPFRSKSSFSFDALIHYDHISIRGTDQTDWGSTTRSTFIEVANPADIEIIAGQMGSFRLQQNEANVNRPITQFEFANLRSLSINSHNVSGDISGGTHPASIIVMGLVSLFMLLLSGINYMNLAVATASRRLKEIGIRKAIGSSKGQIVGQFLTENILTCVLALGVGVGIAYFFFAPGFNVLIQGDGLDFGDATLKYFWMFLAGLLLITGLISGAYPAFYISSFSPTAIFRGSTKLGGENIFTRGLLTFQFVLAFLTMIMGVVMAQNANYQADRDWGYDSELLLVLQTQNESQFSVLETELAQLSGVEEIVGARSHFARSWDQPTIEVDGEKFGAVRFDIGEGFLDMYDVSMISGRGFDASSLTEIDGTVIVNEKFVTTRGWTPESALGKSFREDSLTYSIAGVAGNFIYGYFYDEIEPTYMRAIPEEDYRYMSLKLAAGAGVQTEVAVRDVWKRLLPDQEYNGFFQDTAFQEIFQENTNIKTIFKIIAVLALFIACLGLFSLASQKVARRMKEISIRKVLGASVAHLARKINRSFVIIIVIAAAIASPVGYFAMDALLSSIYADPVTIGPSAFLLSFAFVLVTAVLTIATQVGKLARANPAEVLRNE